MDTIDTDYLVVGAGASGMAFVDALVDEVDAEAVMVDRRDRPGGHWNDAYPFATLHQPAACYGVNSLQLGEDRIDEHGPNAGFYELATASHICHYYERVLEDHLRPTGRVAFLPLHEFLGSGTDGYRLRDRLTGEERTVRVRERLVDATYIESSVPATHQPRYEIDDGVRLVTPAGLASLDEPAANVTVIGAGKTAMDTCVWLLDHGIDPDRIRWVRPRDPWTLDRAWLQPQELLHHFFEGAADQMQVAAQATDVTDLFRQLEACGNLHRLHGQVEPSTYRGAILSARECEKLRSVEHVVRSGQVRRLRTSGITLEHGKERSRSGEVHVDCTAAGLGRRPSRPNFEEERITLQSIQFGIVPYSAALTGYVEATRDDDADKNRLCPPNRNADAAEDWLRTELTLLQAQAEWDGEPDVVAWQERSRLNIARGADTNDPRVASALARLTESAPAAAENLARLYAGVPAAAGA